MVRSKTGKKNVTFFKLVSIFWCVLEDRKHLAEKNLTTNKAKAIV